MQISTAFPSKWLKATDLSGREFTLSINMVQMEDFDDGPKPVLYFIGAQKGMVLNRTNADILHEAFGDETEAWSGQKIVVYSHMTQFKGKRTPGLAVRIPAQPTVPPMPSPVRSDPISTGPASFPGDRPMDDSIPF